MKWWVSLVVASVVFVPGSVGAQQWLKGNTHCHTEFSSDSSTPIEALMSWYKANDYDFVVVTDHNRYTTQQDLNALRLDGAVIADGEFVLIPGEELTTSAHHINGLDLPNRVAPASTISAAFELLWANGALAQLNHPEWSFLEARDIIEEISELDGPMFLEIYNSHPSVIDRSGPSSEDIWDGVLSTGRLMWGVAVDDAHTLEDGDKPPGGGFIYVEADSHDKDEIMSAMANGRFYASTGATLANFSHTRSFYDVDAPGATEIVFIGRGGVELERVQGDFASYRFRGNELYVRARVVSPQGHAWTQPVFVDDLPSNDAPTAVIEASTLRGAAPLTVQFDARGSTDPDGEVVSWRWDFGDGATGRGELILHGYQTPGRYEVALTVFDEQGEPGRATVGVEVVEEGEEPGPMDPDDPPDDGPDPVDPPEDEDPEDDVDEGVLPSASVSSNDGGCAQVDAPGGRRGWPLWPLGALLALVGVRRWRRI